MLNQKQIIEYAVKGINADIEKFEKSIKKAEQILTEVENGKAPKTNKTPYEIKQVLMKKRVEFDELQKVKNELEWQLTELEQ